MVIDQHRRALMRNRAAEDENNWGQDCVSSGTYGQGQGQTPNDELGVHGLGNNTDGKWRRRRRSMRRRMKLMIE